MKPKKSPKPTSEDETPNEAAEPSDSRGVTNTDEVVTHIKSEPNTLGAEEPPITGKPPWTNND